MRTKPDYEGLKVQEWLTYPQALAYTNLTVDDFATNVKPYVNKYMRDKKSVQYSLIELRQRMQQLVVIKALQYE